MKLLKLSISIAVLILTSASLSLALPAPTPEQFIAALSEFIAERSKQEGSPRTTFKKMQSCFPAHKLKDTFLCLAEMEFKEGDKGEIFVQEVGIRKGSDSWKILDPAEATIYAACPPLDIAQSEIRRIRDNQDIEITGEVDDLQGMFSDQRGMMRDKSGPKRLMCRYEGRVRSIEYLYISYAWFAGGKYRIDEVEVWAD